MSVLGGELPFLSGVADQEQAVVWSPQIGDQLLFQ